MKTRFSWVVSTAILASMGGWACGDKGDGSSNGNVCEEKSASYDEAACAECLHEYSACTGQAICDSEDMAVRECALAKCAAEQQAAYDCVEPAYGDCSAKHPEMGNAFDACMESACGAQESALNACGRSKCSAEDNRFKGCIESDCPKAVPCVAGHFD